MSRKTGMEGKKKKKKRSEKGRKGEEKYCRTREEAKHCALKPNQEHYYRTDLVLVARLADISRSA